MAYEITAKSFFEGTLPRMLTRLPELEGVVEFAIEGPGGGMYCVDFTQKRMSSDLPPTCIVRTSAIDFAALMEGRMSVTDGLITERLHLTGEPVFLIRVFEALNQIGGIGA